MIYFPLTAQIVNIEKERIKAHDSAGIEGQMNMSVQLNENKGLVFFSEEIHIFNTKEPNTSCFL